MRPFTVPPRLPSTKPSARAEDDGVRLSKWVAQIQGCSRADAERYIEGGWVRVDGQVAELPQQRIHQAGRHEKVELDVHATLLAQPPVTLVLHKPPMWDAYRFDDDPGRRPVQQLLTIAQHAPGDKAQRVLQQHLVGQRCVTPLEPGASGLVVFTKDWTVQRKLVDDAARVEHELIVDVTGELSEAALRHLNRSPVVDGRAMLPAKVSVTHQPEASDHAPQGALVTGLRFALKGCYPGQIQQMCESVHLRVVAMKRIRVGRVMLSSLPPGQWRYLAMHEKF